MQSLPRSAVALAEARRHIPGGVNSPVRSFRSVGSTPPFIERAEGAYLYDIDGHRYIDYVLSWGPMLLGHAHPAVTQALHEAIERGTSYGAPTIQETELAASITERYPHLPMVRLVNSGTEATMTALRLARAGTGRSKVVKCIGCYHGHSDSFLVAAGSGLATLGVPDSPGVPEGVASDTLVAPYNDLQAVQSLFATYDDIACVIIEPVAGNMGCILPEPGYLEGLRTLTQEHGALLIFDEVMCGLRCAPGGAVEKYGVVPDLTTLGKIIGGGLPLAALGGRTDIMELLAPAGPVYQAGTLSGNPVAVTAGHATLQQLTPEVFSVAAERTEALCQGLLHIASEEQVPVQVTYAGSMFTLFFSDTPVRNFEEAAACDEEAFRIFFHALLEQGIYWAPSRFESNFLSAAHTEQDIEHTLTAARNAFRAVRAAQTQ